MSQLRNLSASRKRTIYSMFALGFFNIGSAVMLFIYQVFYNLEYQVNAKFFHAIEFLMPFQAGSAILIICVPYLRRLLHGTKAKDLRPELNTTNLRIHHRACGEDLEAGEDVDEKTKDTQDVASVENK